MSHLEPTYLRYIYDGLNKGIIHPENSADLPDGLIGLYEEAFDERTSVVERQKLLNRFAIWALLKKEVSVAFVAEVLGESENEIQDFISTFSAWFNSPESGKYQLYHERLRVYLLQKMSEEEIHGLHEKFISRLEHAIKEQKADEFEWYGLEFLAVHVGVSSMLNGDGKKLIDLSYSQTHWNRQLKISKGYTWTKNGLKEVMTWASKYNDDEVIECGMQMVDLNHQEQNSAPQIVDLVSGGDFETVLLRIEQFGGNDKDGLQRKFILYMLCLMELTLNDNTNNSLKKQGIEKLLSHLAEHLPVDHSILNVAEFYPLNSIFQMAIEWENIGIDYSFLKNYYKRFLGNWIYKNKTLQKHEVKVILKLFDSLEFTDDNVVNEFSKLLIENDLITEYFLFRSKILNERKLIYNSIFVIEAFNVIGNFDAVKQLINEIEIFQNNQKDNLLISIVSLRLKIQLMKIKSIKMDKKLIFELLEIIKNAKPELKSSINIRRGYAILISSFLSEFYFYIDEKTKSYLLNEMNMSFIFSQLLIELTTKTNDLLKLNKIEIDSERIDYTEYFIQVQSVISGKYKVLKESIQSNSINKKLLSILEKEKDGLSKNRTTVLLIKELSNQGEFILVKKLLNKITAYHEASKAKIHISIGKLMHKNENTFIQFLEEIDGQTNKLISIKEAFENYSFDLSLRTAFYESLRIDFETNVSEQIKTEFISNLLDFELESLKIENAIKLLSKFDRDRLNATIIRKIVGLIEVGQLHLHFNKRTSNFTIGIHQLNDVVIAEKAFTLLAKGNNEESIQLLYKIENSKLKIEYLIKSAEFLFKKGNLELSKNIIAEIDLEFLLESEKGVNLEHIRLSLVRYWLLTNDIDQAVYQAEFLKSTYKDFAIISISNYLKSLGEKVKSKQLLEQITFLPVKIRENLLLKYDDLDSLINRIDINELRTLISSQCQGNKDYYNYFFYTLAKSSVGKNNINAAFYFVREIKELGIKNECFQEMSLIMKNQSIANQSKRLFDFALDISNDEKKCLVNSIPMNEYSFHILTDLVKLQYVDVVSIKDCFLKYKLNTLINNNDGVEYNRVSNINTNWAKALRENRA